MLLKIFSEIAPFMLEFIVFGVGGALLCFLGGWLLFKLFSKLERSMQGDCPWYQRVGSWLKRQSPLVGLVASLTALVFIYRFLPPLLYWVNGTSTPLPGQENVDGAQILASQQAGGVKQLGAMVSVLLGGTFFFSTILFGVWSLMGYITPALPVWAKKYFTLGFKNVGDDGYVAEAALPVPTQFKYHLVTWFGLIGSWIACLLVAALTQ